MNKIIDKYLGEGSPFNRGAYIKKYIDSLKKDLKKAENYFKNGKLNDGIGMLSLMQGDIEDLMEMAEDELYK